jgi:2-C-methyl-D-erythritol 4-phosphate cytidylyltransferase
MLAEARRMVGDDVAAVVEGGPDRQASVRSGLVAVPPSATVVVCHDAARPLVTAELVDRVVAKVAGRAEAAVPVVPSADTVKRIRSGEVIETVPRDEVGLAQTPQAFVAGVLREAHARALRDGLEATDDAMLLEAYGHTVAVVDGLAANFKITGPEDLERAERILAATSGRAVGTPGG